MIRAIIQYSIIIYFPINAVVLYCNMIILCYCLHISVDPHE